MYPLVALRPDSKNPDLKIAKLTPRFLEILTLFPDDSETCVDFLDFLETQPFGFQKLWGGTETTRNLAIENTSKNLSLENLEMELVSAEDLEMELVSIELENFRGLANQTINLKSELFWAGGQQPIVFIGGNGSGKSSILQAIAKLLSLMTVRLVDSQSNVDKIIDDLDINNYRNKTHITLTIKSCLEPKKTVPISWRLHHAREGVSRSKSEFKELEKWINNYQLAYERDSTLSFPVIVFYSAYRNFTTVNLETQNQTNFRQTDTYKNALVKQKPGFDDFFEWFRDREDFENEQRLNERQSYQDQHLVAVRSACTALLDNFSNLRVRRDFPLRMTVDKEQQSFDVNQLSDGEKSMFVMTGDLARRLAIANPGLSDPLKGRGIVLIDEIDLHLHPQWQNTIIEKLCTTFPNCQFILTTHSPQIITNLESVYLLTNSPDGIISESVRTYGKDSNRILETIMGAPERSIHIKNKFDRLFKLIEDNHLAEASQLRIDLLEELQDDTPELVRAAWIIKRREVLGK